MMLCWQQQNSIYFSEVFVIPGYMQAQVYEIDLDYGQQHLEGNLCNQKKKVF